MWRGGVKDVDEEGIEKDVEWRGEGWRRGETHVEGRGEECGGRGEGCGGEG